MLEKAYFRFSVIFYTVTQFVVPVATAADPAPSSGSGKVTFDELTDNTLFSGVTKVKQSVGTLNWVLTLIPVFPSLYCMLVAGNRFKNQDFAGAAAAFAGSIVCAIASFAVHKMLS